MKAIRFVVAAGAVLSVLPIQAHAIVECTSGGKPVQDLPDGFSGIVTRKHDTGELSREESYSAGKKVGRQIQITFDNRRIEYLTDAEEQKSGPERIFLTSGRPPQLPEAAPPQNVACGFPALRSSETV